MMATTHAFVGAALASVTILFAPEAAPVAIAAGFVGGIVPDLDVAFEHRRTLHFPVLASLAAVLLAGVALVRPTALTIALVAFATAVAVHPIMDHFGGSAEARPWLRTTDRAVYDHYNGRWLPARRWIRYDGSPEDMCLALVASAPVVALADGPLRFVAVAALLVSLGYTLFRKRVFDVWDDLVAALPPSILARLPGVDSHSAGTDERDRSGPRKIDARNRRQ